MLLILSIISIISEVVAGVIALLLGLSFTKNEKRKHKIIRTIIKNNLNELIKMIAQLGPQAGLTGQSRIEYVTVGMVIGTEMYKDKNYKKALEWYLAVDKFVNSATLSAKIADCYYYLEEYQEAIYYEEEAENMAPDWSGPPFRKAQSLYMLGKKDEALKWANRSCTLGFDGGCKLAEWILVN
jgi:tetratricopeptide (TPR) repeat protein